MKHKIIDASVTDANKLYNEYMIKNLFDKLRTKGSPSFLSDWTAVEFIGEGSYSKVFKAVHGNGNDVQVSAIKIIELPYPIPLNEFPDDTNLLSVLNNCPNIVHQYEYSQITLDEPNMQTKYYYAIRMEYLTPVSAESFSKREIPKLADDICSAISYCHGQNPPIVHCDIKPGNILVDSIGNYKLAAAVDTMQLCDPDPSSCAARGTPKFMLPELLTNEEHNSPLSDLYSFGCTLYALYNGGSVPFWNEFLKSDEYKQNGELSWIVYRRKHRNQLVPRIKGIRPGMMTIIRRLCHYSADKRFSSAQEVQRLLKSPLRKRRVTPSGN